MSNNEQPTRIFRGTLSQLAEVFYAIDNNGVWTRTETNPRFTIGTSTFVTWYPKKGTLLFQGSQASTMYYLFDVQLEAQQKRWAEEGRNGKLKCFHSGKVVNTLDFLLEEC